MKKLFAVTAAAAALGFGGIALSAGFDTAMDVYLASLQSDRANYTAAADLKRVDAAIAAITPVSATVTAEIKAVEKAVKALGPLAKNADLAPDIVTATGVVFSQVEGRAVQSQFATGNWALTHTSLGQLLTVAHTNIAIGKLIKKQEDANGNASLTPAQKLKLYEKNSVAFDKIIKKFGPKM
jgi:hypothetical protein